MMTWWLDRLSRRRWRKVAAPSIQAMEANIDQQRSTNRVTASEVRAGMADPPEVLNASAFAYRNAVLGWMFERLQRRGPCLLSGHRWLPVLRYLPAWDGVIRPYAICVAEPALVPTGEFCCPRCRARMKVEVDC